MHPCGDGKGEVEGASAIFIRADPKASFVRLDDRAADGQAHAHPLRLRGEERLEDLLHFLLADSLAAIAHEDFHGLLVAPPRADAQHPLLFGHLVHRLQAVAGEVHHDLFDLDRIGHHRRDVGRQFTDDLGASLLQFQVVDRNRLLDQIVQRNGGNMRAGFLHEVADPAEDFRRAVRLLRDAFQGRHQFAVMFRSLEQAANASPGVVLRGVQRLVQFVGQARRHLAHDAQTRHVGQLDLVQLQLLLAGAQVAFDLLPPGDVAIQPVDQIGQVAADDAEKSQAPTGVEIRQSEKILAARQKRSCNGRSQRDVQNRRAQSTIPGGQNDRCEDRR